MKLKVALCQIEVVPGRPDINAVTILEMISQAKKAKVDIAILPEMSIPGYLIGDTWEQTSFLKDCEEYGNKIIAASEDIVIMFGNVAIDWNKKNEDGRVRKYNAFFVAQNKKLIGAENFIYPYRIKTLLPDYRQFDDNRHFFGLSKLAMELDQSVKDILQPVLIPIKNEVLAVGCLICEDGWSDDYPVNPINILKEYHPQLLVNISNSPFTLGKNNKRNRVFSKQALKSKAPLIYVNNVGIQNNGKTVYCFEGHSTVYNQQGTIIAEIEESFKPTCKLLDLNFDFDGVKEKEFITPDEPEIVQIYHALNYGIRKFTDSLHLKKVVIGISGGIDSAVTAALYAQALGSENLILVNMPSIYNSKTTKDLALKLAQNLGCYYTIISIQESVDHTKQQIEKAEVINPLNGERFDLRLTSFMNENVQARDRSSRILAAVAASFQGVFTCNANKAETTVGYSTLYGDQSGFLAALADLWKYQVYQLATHLNECVYKREVIPKGIIDIVPSAELSFNQSVDEGKGDPLVYPYHDYLFRAFVERWNRATPEDILGWYLDGTLEKNIGCSKGIINNLFATPIDFITDLERWWQLFNGIGVAKRIQAPPLLAVSRRAFGFDYRESQNGVYYSQQYLNLKEKAMKPK